MWTLVIQLAFLKHDFVLKISIENAAKKYFVTSVDRSLYARGGSQHRPFCSPGGYIDWCCPCVHSVPCVHPVPCVYPVLCVYPTQHLVYNQYFVCTQCLLCTSTLTFFGCTSLTIVLLETIWGLKRELAWMGSWSRGTEYFPFFSFWVVYTRNITFKAYGQISSILSLHMDLPSRCIDALRNFSSLMLLEDHNYQ